MSLFHHIACFAQIAYCSLVQGLPSAYLAPMSFLTDATDQSSLDSSTLASLTQGHSLTPHTPTPLPLTTITTDTTPHDNVTTSTPSSSHNSLASSSSSLPSSLKELAGALGGEHVQPLTGGAATEFSGKMQHGIVSSISGTTAGAVGGEHVEGASDRKSSGVYNPFDSDGE